MTKDEKNILDDLLNLGIDLFKDGRKKGKEKLEEKIKETLQDKINDATKDIINKFKNDHYIHIRNSEDITLTDINIALKENNYVMLEMLLDNYQGNLDLSAYHAEIAFNASSKEDYEKLQKKKVKYHKDKTNY